MGIASRKGTNRMAQHGTPRNIAAVIEGDELVIRVKIGAADFAASPLTEKGRSVVVATSDGWLKLGLQAQGCDLAFSGGIYAKLPK
jgi:hypothetical protein